VPSHLEPVAAVTPICALARVSELTAGMPVRPTWLSATELARWDSFGSSARRHSFVAGRWLVRHLVAQVLGGEPDAVPLRIDVHGRSSVDNAPSLSLSISHSGDWVSGALAMTPIGIDLECLRPRRDLLAMAATVHSPAQLQALVDLQDEAQLRCFYQWWTLKEAWLKRQGLALNFARMRGLEYRITVADESAQALSLVDVERGLVLALDGDAVNAVDGPTGFDVVQRYVLI